MSGTRLPALVGKRQVANVSVPVIARAQSNLEDDTVAGCERTAFRVGCPTWSDGFPDGTADVETCLVTLGES